MKFEKENFRESKVSMDDFAKYCRCQETIECVSVWYNNISTANRQEAFDLMCNSLNKVELIDAMWHLFRGKEIEIANIIRNSRSMSIISKSNIKRIAIYYVNMWRGGVQRVISLLIPLYRAMGYSVILITDEEASDADFYIADDIRRYVVSSIQSVYSGDSRYLERGRLLQKVMQDEKIDVLCYHASHSPLLFFDLLLSKFVNVEFVLTRHELFSQSMARMANEMDYGIAVYPLTDKMTVLSEIERIYWKIMEVDTFYIPNPRPELKLKCEHRSDEEYILWTGRLDRNQKRYQDIIPIISLVVQRIPDVKVKVFGSPMAANEDKDLANSITAAGLEKNIEYCGYTTDLEEIYKGAIIHLVTSSYESFPMGIFESHEIGIPLVTYDMPYVEILKGDEGSICVEPLNYRMAAEALILLINNVQLRKKMGEAAKTTVQRFNNEIVIDGWKNVFSPYKTIEQCNDIKISDYKIILQTIVDHYSLGCKEAAMHQAKLAERIETLQKEKWIKEIGQKISEMGVAPVLYPFGDIGRKTKELLNLHGIAEAFVVDNGLAKGNESILSVNDLKKVNCHEYLFIICSDKLSIYYEIRNAIMEMVPKENIYDMFPQADGY